MHFPTLEDAYLCYEEYVRQCGFDVRNSTNKTDRSGNILGKYMLGSRGGDPYANKLRDMSGNYIEGPSKRTSSQRCFCKARIILKPVPIKGFVIMGFKEEHNHPLATGRSKMFLRCNRNVSVAYQNFIFDCGRANIEPTRAHSLVKEMTSSYEDFDATIADQLWLFWTDAIGRANYDVYGDIISFDPTFRTNRYHMIFVSFTGVDNHWKNVTFAVGLLARENYKNFKWLLRSFKRAMGHVPTTIGPKLASNKKFVRKLKDAVYSDHLTPVQFEERWEAVIAEFNLELNQWLSEMFGIQDQWIPSYFSDNEMASLLRTTSRRGYLCRHSFVALHRCRVKTIPRQFLKARWTKNALQDHTRAWFAFKNLINLAGDDKEKVDTILATMKHINTSFLETTRAQTNNGLAHRADWFITPVESEVVTIRNPDISRNKGCVKGIC
ncbi:hypothetical protein DCAR_0101169 [Daucus carota subsp. sativus]|uniref:Protein FAR1-RELATED SEQUENCE n=1 Tax=Daucus carota subsp. sativus TaxID=79200 RepID=A0AAF0W284_DAUCS|nr:PREDICTED: protein FAR-RED IMPAIRED RESPONSE 1-like [Daucus carota subsp. sativus]WOG82010.1 hypothetical protein DCAR_0101169 [Daucus carota subsp. sativus]